MIEARSSSADRVRKSFVRQKLPACRVRPAQMASAQPDDLREHPQAVAKDMDLAALVMIPAHRPLQQAQSRFAREVEQLDIKAETLSARLLDERARSLHPEGF